MDFGKSNRVPPNANIIRDFDLNKPWMEEEDLHLNNNNNAENESSSSPLLLIHSNNSGTTQNDTDGRDNEVHKSTTCSSNGRARRHFQARHYVTSISSGPHGAAARGRGKLVEGRRRYHRRGGGVLMQSDPYRYCTNYYCRTRKTPLWRKGPLGPKTLCNACGIDYMKQVTSRGSGITTFPNVVANHEEGH